MMTQLISKLPHLLGLRCWGVVAGVGNGSMVTFHLGALIPRNPALMNHHLSDQLRKYQGEYCIFVKGCSWNLNVGSRIVCASTDDERKIGAELRGRLTGATITRTSADESTANLDLEFGECGLLSLSCQQSSENGIDNYAIRFPSGWIKVDRDKLVRTAPA